MITKTSSNQPCERNIGYNSGAFLKCVFFFIIIIFYLYCIDPIQNNSACPLSPLAVSISEMKS